VDKSSTDDSYDVARTIADRVERVPWTPLGEHTRGYAESLCTNDWIIYLDDDEILSPNAEPVFRRLIADNEAPVFFIPIFHYFLGRWDHRVNDQEWRPVLHRRGELNHAQRLHTDAEIPGQKAMFVCDGSAWIHHLAHPDVTSWVEKTNRYTTISQDQNPNRKFQYPTLESFVRESVVYRFNERAIVDMYGEAVATLRVIYDLIEGLKCWERGQPDGHAAFDAFCREIEEER